jgi:hypothetical protein
MGNYFYSQLDLFLKFSMERPETFNQLGIKLGIYQIKHKLKKTTPHQKAIDYHHLIELILEGLIQCQKDK